MLTAKFSDAKIFQKIIALTKGLVTQMELTFFKSSKKGDQTAMEIITMTRSNVCLVWIRLNEKDFDEYTCDAPEVIDVIEKPILDDNGDDTGKVETIEKKSHKYSLYVDVNHFTSVLERLRSGEKITLKYDPDGDNKNKLVVDMKKDEATKSREFTIVLEKDFDYSEISMEKLDSIEHKNKIKTNFGLIQDAVKDAKIYGDYIDFEVESKDLTLSTESGIGSMIFPVEDELLDEKDLPMDLAISYEIGWIEHMLKAGTISQSVSLEFGQDTYIDEKGNEQKADTPDKQETPLKAIFHYGDSKITFFIAQKTDEEEDFEEFDEFDDLADDELLIDDEFDEESLEDDFDDDELYEEDE